MFIPQTIRDTDMFPHITTAILQAHCDEVWDLKWSHDGKFLASASKDKSVIIWTVGDLGACVISTSDFRLLTPWLMRVIA